MAFAVSTIYRLENPGGRATIRCYAYTSPDDLATVTTAGYFTPNVRFKFRPNDVILSSLSDGFFILALGPDASTATLAVAGSSDSPVVNTDLIRAESALTSQNPPGTDSPITIDFGGPIGSGSDAIQLLANQHFLANRDIPNAWARLRLNVSRTTNPGISQLFVRTLLNGEQPFSSLNFRLDDDNWVWPYDLTQWFTLNEGDEIWFELVRDSSGNNSGGLEASTPTLVDWNPASTALAIISEAVVQ